MCIVLVVHERLKPTRFSFLQKRVWLWNACGGVNLNLIEEMKFHGSVNYSFPKIITRNFRLSVKLYWITEKCSCYFYLFFIVYNQANIIRSTSYKIISSKIERSISLLSIHKWTFLLNSSLENSSFMFCTFCTIRSECCT